MNTSADNPWQKIDEEIRYDNPWIKVTHSNVITPSGSKGIYGSVHFKNWAIGMIPLDKNLNTWIVGQYRYPIQQYSWFRKSVLANFFKGLRVFGGLRLV